MRHRSFRAGYALAVGLGIGILMLLGLFLWGEASTRKQAKGSEHALGVAMLISPTALMTPIVFPSPILTVYPTYIEPPPTNVPSPPASPSTAATSQPTPLYAEERWVERDFGAWHFTAVQRRDGRVEAGVHYDGQSIEGLFAYAQTNKELAPQVGARGGEVEVRITFRSYVEPDRYRAWALPYHLKPE